MSGKRILVVGDADIDFYINVDHIPTHDEGILATSSFSLPGGKAANSAYALSSLGSDTALFAVIGRDKRGEDALESLKKIGTDLSLVSYSDNETTLCIMLLDSTGEKAIVVLPSPDIYPGKEFSHVLDGKGKDFDHVHVIAMNPEKISWVCTWAKENGLTLSMDIDSANGGMKRFENILKKADIVFMNRQGLHSLTDDDSNDGKKGLEELYGQFGNIIISTLGKDGSSIISGEGFSHVDAILVKAKDTSGCGDAFASGFLHSYLNLVYPLTEALKFASRSAAVAAVCYGGQGGSWSSLGKGGQ